MTTELLACAACGYRTVWDEYDICEICGWEADLLQESDPDYPGGANPGSLREAQARAVSGRAHRRHPGPDDVRDPEWRPFLQPDQFNVGGLRNLAVDPDADPRDRADAIRLLGLRRDIVATAPIIRELHTRLPAVIVALDALEPAVDAPYRYLSRADMPSELLTRFERHGLSNELAEPLVKQLVSARVAIVIAAIQALGRVPDERARATLRELVGTGLPAHLLRAVTDAIGEQRDPVAIPALRNAATHAPGWLQGWMCAALCRIGHRDGLAAAKDILDLMDPDRRRTTASLIRSVVAEALPTSDAAQQEEIRVFLAQIES